MLLIKFTYLLRDPNEAKYQNLIKNRENSVFENLKDPKTLIEYSNNMQGVYKILESATQAENVLY